MRYAYDAGDGSLQKKTIGFSVRFTCCSYELELNRIEMDFKRTRGTWVVFPTLQLSQERHTFSATQDEGATLLLPVDRPPALTCRTCFMLCFYRQALTGQCLVRERVSSFTPHVSAAGNSSR